MPEPPPDRTWEVQVGGTLDLKDSQHRLYQESRIDGQLRERSEERWKP